MNPPFTDPRKRQETPFWRRYSGDPYLAELTGHGEGVGDVLDRHHQAQNRQRRL